MKKQLWVTVIIFVLIFTACSKIDTDIDLVDLKNDSGTFCYENLYWNSTLDEVKKIIGYDLRLVSTSENNEITLYTIETDFTLLGRTIMATVEFEHDQLVAIKFLLRNQDNDVVNLYTELTEKLIELYFAASETINFSGETELGYMQSEGFLWYTDDENIRTGLQVIKAQMGERNPSISFAIFSYRNTPLKQN